ncbi:hypothetical protein [Enterobacter sp. CGMCC 5087]|uniref:hypothetical protein n=1 Tax=Enterobacter sp. CGMCC 5087 TaxID=2183878 RepID=UPI00215AEC51|nr:hypothetical protein [Enterobacter sp. CGMCC 5087]
MTSMTPKRPTKELVHLAWCILVSVGLARQEGKALSTIQTHLFIMQWLLTAQKRKIFPRILASDILWL